MCCSYVRWSINFFLFRSSEMPPITLTDDEHEIAVVVPKKRRQHCGALGAAVVSHFSYCEVLDSEILGPHAAAQPLGLRHGCSSARTSMLDCCPLRQQHCRAVGPAMVLLFSLYEDWAALQDSCLCLCML